MLHRPSVFFVGTDKSARRLVVSDSVAIFILPCATLWILFLVLPWKGKVSKKGILFGTYFLTESSFVFTTGRFGRSTALYASWLMALIVVGEYATGKITDGLWTANNYGKTFETVDWSKFDEFEDEEDDDDE